MSTEVDVTARLLPAQRGLLENQWVSDLSGQLRAHERSELGSTGDPP